MSRELTRRELAALLGAGALAGAAPSVGSGPVVRPGVVGLARAEAELGKSVEEGGFAGHEGLEIDRPAFVDVSGSGFLRVEAGGEQVVLVWAEVVVECQDAGTAGGVEIRTTRSQLSSR